MNRLRLVFALSLPLLGCDPGPTNVQPLLQQTPSAPTPVDSRAEIEAVVTERLEQERLKWETDQANREKEIEERVKLEVAAELAKKERQEREAQELRRQREQEEETRPRQPVATTVSADALAPEPRPQPQSLPQEETGYEVFYEELAPYGAWFQVPDYGYVWRPYVSSDVEWRPYLDGQWGYTDQGWAWISNEPFGWATYHYGRWASLEDLGWVWVPGSEWAPAWVSWREDEDYVGWAPLPPRSNVVNLTVGSAVDTFYDIGPGAYCFVPAYYFGAHSYRNVVVRREENIRIIERTRNVTNIRIVNRTVHCHGPQYDRIRIISREPVGRIRLVVQTDRDSLKKVRPLAVQGRTELDCYMPRISRTRNDAKPSLVEGRVETRKEKNGWEIIKDENEKTRIRQSLATGPRLVKVESKPQLQETPERVQKPQLQEENNNRPPQPQLSNEPNKERRQQPALEDSQREQANQQRERAEKQNQRTTVQERNPEPREQPKLRTESVTRPQQEQRQSTQVRTQQAQPRQERQSKPALSEPAKVPQQQKQSGGGSGQGGNKKSQEEEAAQGKGRKN